MLQPTEGSPPATTLFHGWPPPALVGPHAVTILLWWRPPCHEDRLFHVTESGLDLVIDSLCPTACDGHEDYEIVNLDGSPWLGSEKRAA
jgi:hypothetical protein